MDVCVSSWQRVAPNTLPALAKAGGNYLSGQLIGAEARRLGFSEGIGLSTDGTVSEGSGENIFLVKDGVLLTPALAHSVLSGLTRDTIIRLAKERGIEVRECAIPRELLYLADEAFFTGTAAEIAPIRSVDRLTVGAGKRGPITENLQNAFFGLFTGKTADTVGLARSCRYGGRAPRRRSRLNGVTEESCHKPRKRCSKRSGTNTRSPLSRPIHRLSCISTCT